MWRPGRPPQLKPLEGYLVSNLLSFSTLADRQWIFNGPAISVREESVHV